jgi:hypothetical protein
MAGIEPEMLVWIFCISLQLILLRHGILHSLAELIAELSCFKSCTMIGRVMPDVISCKMPSGRH